MGGSHIIYGYNEWVDMGMSMRATSVAHQTQVETLAEHTTIDGWEGNSAENTTGVLTREKAEMLDGPEVWYLISIPAVATATTTIISITTRDSRRYRSETTQMGLEPTTFGSEVRRAIHYATRPYLEYLCAQRAEGGR